MNTTWPQMSGRGLLARPTRLPIPPRQCLCRQYSPMAYECGFVANCKLTEWVLFCGLLWFIVCVLLCLFIVVFGCFLSLFSCFPSFLLQFPSFFLYFYSIFVTFYIIFISFYITFLSFLPSFPPFLPPSTG